ncbi:hypothetical protein [Melittangium boletus]|uniref:hypothetical protein n=1 Tax=Melittangium boletus TaxID=83453 RepID=UPI003DA57034
MELSGVFGEGELESRSRSRLRKQPEHLWLLCFIAPLIQAEILFIEPTREALDLLEQMMVCLSSVADVLKRGDNLFTFETDPRGDK